MRRTLALAGVALALLAAAAVSVAAPTQRDRPTAVGVGEREWRIALYRSRVPTGRVKFNVRNYGEDGHDLAVRTRSGRRLATLPEVEPGETGSLTVRLRRRGGYVVFCSLAGHEQLGMRAVLQVVRASVRGRPSRPPPARRRR